MATTQKMPPAYSPTPDCAKPTGRKPAAVTNVPVIAGTGGNATSEALELHQFAKRAGATACLSVNPYYNKPSQEGLYHHFMTLADRVDLPIVLYNIPGRTGITMTPQTVARLNQHTNIVAIKEASGDIVRAAALIRDLPAGFSLYSG